jgi:GT2 family glycosyltransferase
VLGNNYPNYEIVVVDNASKDGTLNVIEEVIKNYKAKVKVIKNPRNYGISRGSNIGVSHSSGKYLAFLDSDAFPDPNWLFQPIELMERDPSIGAVQAKVLRAGLPDDQVKIIDCAGILMDLGLYTYRRGSMEEDKGQYDKVDEIFCPMHTGAIIRTKAFLEVGGFDEIFSVGGHEADLGWRLWRKGYRVVFAPDSVVYHKRGWGSASRLKWRCYYNEQATLVLMVKYASLKLLLKKLLLYGLKALLEASGIIDQKREVTLSRFLALFHILKCFKSIWLRRISHARHQREDERRILMRCSIEMLKSHRKVSWRHRLWYKPLMRGRAF